MVEPTLSRPVATPCLSPPCLSLLISRTLLNRGADPQEPKPRLAGGVRGDHEPDGVAAAAQRPVARCGLSAALAAAASAGGQPGLAAARRGVPRGGAAAARGRTLPRRTRPDLPGEKEARTLQSGFQ